MGSKNNPNPYSARMTFQWKYFSKAPVPLEGEQPHVLNIGCADDPLEFGCGAMHYDIDDWSATHKWFTQGDAHQLPFGDMSYHTVILGDILEHAVDPVRMVCEAMRVCKDTMVLTIFEEWTLPGYGQYIKEGQENCDISSRDHGAKDREDFQRKTYPDRIGFPDNRIPHLAHINQFTDEDIGQLAGMVQRNGFEVMECIKVFEITHEGHDIYNWLVAAKRSNQ